MFPMKPLLLLLCLFPFCGCRSHSAPVVPVVVTHAPVLSRPVSPLFNPVLSDTLLEGKNRDWWQKPQQIITALKLKPGSTVADIGTGSGYFLPYLSRAVGAKGTVYAEEVQEDFLSPLQRRADQFKNVRLVLGTETDPKLPLLSTDTFVLMTVYHEVKQGTEFLRGLHRFAKPNAQLVIIDFDAKRKGSHPAPEGHAISEEIVVQEAKAAGWTLKKRYEFLGSQFFLVFE